MSSLTLARSAASASAFTAPTVTPADLALTVRDLRFMRNRPPGRWWLNGDAVATAWYNALSATFPRGEATFIEAVKAHRDGTPPELAAQIRAFIQQEINHTREHVALNRAAVDAGYRLDEIDARLATFIARVNDREPIFNLAATIALEHYTAIMANELLATPAHCAGADPEVTALWKWHAIEEIEHKGVAYDTWLHATRDWSKARRWRVRCIMMLVVSLNFFTHRIQDTLELLRQDGLTGWRIKLRVAKFLLVGPGMLRRIFPAWLSFFKPGFHPWDHDDRALIVDAARDLAARAG